MIITIPVITIFGTNVSVISWICVAAWTIEITRPTIRLAARNGSASLKPSTAACVVSWMATSPFTGGPLRRRRAVPSRLVERVDDPLDDERPAVDEHEEQDLERERDEDRGQHHHPHGHKRRRDDHVD